MQEMPRFSKAPRPPDGFIKGAYWPGACLAPIARPGDGMLGIFPNFPVLGKLIRQAREMSRFGEKLGIFPNIPHVLIDNRKVDIITIVRAIFVSDDIHFCDL